MNAVLTPTLAELAGDLATGKISSRELVEAALGRIADPEGQGALIFISVDGKGARAAADAQDALRRKSNAPSEFAGIPISVKDLFDLEGQVTTAGSKVLADAAPAKADAVAIARLKAKGFVVLGRSNMTEFAYSGVGLNPHYGTPLNAFDRATGRVPGGSSSGAALSVADGICALGIGTDTGGSCRIPAAYNGIVGFKPTARRVSKEGVFPLAQSLDSIGPLARSVQCCASADAIMAGDWDGNLSSGPSRKLRVGVLQSLVLDQLDAAVSEDFNNCLGMLREAGMDVEPVHFPELLELPRLQQRASLVGIEAYQVHRQRLGARGDEYDPRVSGRLRSVSTALAVDYLDLVSARRGMIEAFAKLAADYDALVWPSVANVAPPIAALSRDDEYARLNGVSLRNAAVVNFVDGCAVTIPMNHANQAPTGLMICGGGGFDQQILAAAARCAGLVSGHLSQ